MSIIDCPEFSELDLEIKREFYEDVVAAIADINLCVEELAAGDDAQVIDRMYRALHTVKGNCNMVFLVPFVDASHKLEDLFSKIRSGDFEYAPAYGKFAIAVVNVIQQLLSKIVEGEPTDDDALKSLTILIDQIEQADTSNKHSIAERAVIAIQDGHYNVELVTSDNNTGGAFSFLEASDLEFFEFINHKQNENDDSGRQFTKIYETLALKLNALLKNSIDEQELKSIVVFTTLTRSFAPVLCPKALTLEEVYMATGLLNRMSGWGKAGEVTLQLLERYDGGGVPKGLKADEISPAAQAIALAYEFASIVICHSAKGYKAALFTAVKAINAEKNTAYKERLIERFNQVIKSDYLSTVMW